jgi:hypothetical protein
MIMLVKTKGKVVDSGLQEPVNMDTMIAETPMTIGTRNPSATYFTCFFLSFSRVEK